MEQRAGLSRRPEALGAPEAVPTLSTSDGRTAAPSKHTQDNTGVPAQPQVLPCHP